MKKKKAKRGVLYYLFVLQIMIAIGIRSGWSLEMFTEEQLPEMDIAMAKTIFPATQNFESVEEGQYLLKKGKKTLGVALTVEGDRGYGGKVPLLIGIEKQKIKQIDLLPNHETQEFLTYIANDSLLKQWLSMPVDKVLNTHVDAVSGATISSDAIIHGVQMGVANYLNETNQAQSIDWWKLIQDILFLMIIGFALFLAYNRKAKKYRLAYLAVMLVVLGIVTGKVLSVKLVQGWLSHGIAWRTNWYSIILIGLALVMPLLKRPMFYCTYLCPMGAFQELINKYSPYKRKTIKLKKKAFALEEIYLGIIWVSLILGFTPELSHLEPFMVFSYKVVGWGFFLVTALIGVMSFFYNKPWCAVCPTGCLLGAVSHKK